MRALIVAATAMLLAIAGPAHAQRELEHVLGKPMRSTDLAAGTIVVRVTRAAAKDIAIVVVTSDADAEDVRACFGEHPPFAVVLDAPAANEAIGPLTRAMKIDAVPETYLIDAHGIARFHDVAVHDFASPEVARCVATIAR